jgi:ubiquinone/menaquinone biosynthesis C-methylase UbiE
MSRRFHSIQDYQAMVRSLMAAHPLDEAMSLAVGGGYEAIGQEELRIVKDAGFKAGQFIIDVGCGSGRLSSALYAEFGPNLVYRGTDVVRELLDYAQGKANSPRYFFTLVKDLTIPFQDHVADMVCFFSVFTHLLPEESYRYLLEAKRVLKPGGTIVLSYLTLEVHWDIFMDSVRQDPAHLNTFLHERQLDLMLDKAGFKVVLGSDPTPEFGQCVCVARSL